MASVWDLPQLFEKALHSVNLFGELIIRLPAKLRLFVAFLDGLVVDYDNAAIDLIEVDQVRTGLLFER